MTKQELKTELETSFLKLGLIKGAEDSQLGYQIRIKEGVLWYIVGVYEQSDNVLYRRNIHFYCVPTGSLPKEQMGTLSWVDLPEGDYYYCERPLQKTTIAQKNDTTFQDSVKNIIDTKVTAGVIVKGTIENMLPSEKIAVVKAYQMVSGELVEKKFLVCEVAGKLAINPIKS